jgi:hypothetical protein
MLKRNTKTKDVRIAGKQNPFPNSTAIPLPLTDGNPNAAPVNGSMIYSGELQSVIVKFYSDTSGSRNVNAVQGFNERGYRIARALRILSE